MPNHKKNFAASQGQLSKKAVGIPHQSHDRHGAVKTRRLRSVSAFSLFDNLIKSHAVHCIQCAFTIVMRTHETSWG